MKLDYFLYRKELLFYRMPHKVPASKAIINNSVLVDSNPAVNPGHKIAMTILAELFLKRRRQPYLMLHGYPSCHFDIFV